MSAFGMKDGPRSTLTSRSALYKPDARMSKVKRQSRPRKAKSGRANMYRSITFG